MAQSKIDLSFEWENDVDFTLTQKIDGVEVILIHVEENGCIESVWSHATAMVGKYVSNIMDKVGGEMAE